VRVLAFSAFVRRSLAACVDMSTTNDRIRRTARRVLVNECNVFFELTSALESIECPELDCTTREVVARAAARAARAAFIRAMRMPPSTCWKCHKPTPAHLTVLDDVEPTCDACYAEIQASAQ